MNPERKLILVTGSSGFLGSALIRTMGPEFNVVGLDQEGPPHPPDRAEAVEVDLASEESVRDALAGIRRRHGTRIESVVHLAAYYDFSGAPSPRYEEINIRGTERLLRHLRGFQVGQIVFSSTHLVHAPALPGRRIDETSPLDPRWAYPESKLRAEQEIRKGQGFVPTVVLRIAGVYDDGCRSIPLAHQIQRIYENRLTGHLYPGDRSRGQPFVHVDDVVRSIRLAIGRRRELTGQRVFLIGEERTVSYDQLQRTLALLVHGRSWKTRAVPKPIAKAGAWIQNRFGSTFIRPWMIDFTDDHYDLDISRARAQLDWEPERSLQKTLPRIVDALLADPVAWYRQNKLRLPRRLRKAAG